MKKKQKVKIKYITRVVEKPADITKILDMNRMMFLGYSVESWLNMWSACRANLNMEDPNEIARHINLRGLR